MPTTLHPDDERLLTDAMALRLWRAGGPAGGGPGPELRFAFRDGLVLLLADPGDGDPWLGWRGSQPPERVELEVSGIHYLGIPDSAGRHDLDLSDVLALFRDKYGMQLVKVWFEGRACLPIVISLVQRLPCA